MNDHVTVLGFPAADLANFEPLAPAGQDPGLQFESPRQLARKIPAPATDRPTTPLVEAVADVAAEVVDSDPHDPNNPETPAVLVVTDGKQDSTTAPGQRARAIAEIRQRQKTDGLKVYIVVIGTEPFQTVGRITGRSSRPSGLAPGQLLVRALTSGAASSPGDRLFCLSRRADCTTAQTRVAAGPDQSGPDLGRARAVINLIVRQLGG